MSGGAAAGGAAAAAAAAVAQAIKASGAIVSVEPADFASLLSKSDAPLVVHAEGGFFTTNYQYLTAYRGLIFYTKSPAPINLPPKTELMVAKRIWVPG